MSLIARGRMFWCLVLMAALLAPGFAVASPASSTAYRPLSVASSGRVVAWGETFAGPIAPPGDALSGVTAVSAGSSHSLALKGGKVLAWGGCFQGQCAVPTEAQEGVSAIAAGGIHSLALKNGRVYAWGSDNWGQASVPSSALDGVAAVSTTGVHNLALKNGGVLCWGSNNDGRCTVPADAQSGVEAVAAGGAHSLALKEGKVIAWGWNQYEQATVPSYALSGVSAIAAGGDFSVVLKNGRVYVWGWNGYGVVDVPEDAQSGVTAISADGNSVLALKNGRVVAWGSGSWAVPSDTQSGAIAIDAGYWHSLAVVASAADTTPPSITPVVAGTVGSNGWYTSSVTVTWTVNDGDSSVTSTTGCGSINITADTPGTTLTCSATSGGGTASNSVTIKRDGTAPTLAPVVQPNPVFQGAAASASANATDALSGVADASCGAVNTDSLGAKSVSCSASDNAGNNSTATANYSVISSVYNFGGFLPGLDPQPAFNRVKAGSTVPVKFSLAGDRGMEIMAAGFPQSDAIECPAESSLDAITGVASVSSQGKPAADPPASKLVYDVSSDQYVYLWRTDSTWTGCRRLDVRLADGSTYSANFSFEK